MATNHKYSKDLIRSVAWTSCEGGPLDLRPVTASDNSHYLDACIDFEEHSYYQPPTQGEPMPCWTPGYAERANRVMATICSDLLAVTMENVSPHEVLGWLIEHNIAGLVWPTIMDMQPRPACCLTLLLNRTVNAQTYQQLWLKLARDVFTDCLDSEQSDCRYRFHSPRTIDGQSQLLRHDGHAIPVDYVISRDAITSEAIADYAATHAVYIVGDYQKTHAFGGVEHCI